MAPHLPPGFLIGLMLPHSIPGQSEVFLISLLLGRLEETPNNPKPSDLVLELQVLKCLPKSSVSQTHNHKHIPSINHFSFPDRSMSTH